MDVDPVNKLKRLKAEYQTDRADVEAELHELERKLDELERQRDELQRLIDGVDGVLSNIKDDSGHPQTAPVVSPSPGHGVDSAPLQKDASTTNGSLKGPSRRQLVLRIVPEFRGETFEASDVRAKLLEEYLDEEPPSFPQAINNLLKRMANDGEITRVGRKGDKPTAPWLYQEKQHDEETLLRSGP